MEECIYRKRMPILPP